ncbi:CBS domain protein [Streptomyces sp. NBRC 110611]|nr:CBS domain protein [Streptomyces sp. NBRC 110611]
MRSPDGMGVVLSLVVRCARRGWAGREGGARTGGSEPREYLDGNRYHCMIARLSV